MGRILVMENLTLDGVMQAPGRADEDPRDGFDYGGWAQQYNDEVAAWQMGLGQRRRRRCCSGGGRTRTSPGSGRTRRTNPFTPLLDAATKYVASTTWPSAGLGELRPARR